eukprot:TRINITY_DN13856_c0_g1_i1.p1 TRINITY_DN13856_c0_g1~~TRINITY_DN13856_c0_g1_i1.p1  ORF type:complete len:404 (+),score=77.82 TRINITY_DN13856_c0_g1_i1:381-1592(+)
MQKIAFIFVFGMLVSICSSAVITARNITYTENQSTATFTFEGRGAALDTKQKLIGVDLLAFLASKNVMVYEHFAAVADYKNGGNLTDAITASFAFLLRFHALVEYEETNGVPGFQHVGWNADNGTNDHILSAYYNDTVGDTVQWYIDIHEDNVVFANALTKLYTLTIGTTDGVFNWTATYTGSLFNTKRATIDANSFKIGFNINYYNYDGASNSSQSQVALVLLAGAEKSATKSVTWNGTDVSGLHVNSGGYKGFINFENQADTWDLSGVYKNSHVTFSYVNNYQVSLGIIDWTAAAFFLSYDAIRPQTISYDPEFGADLPPVDGSTTSVVGSTTGTQANPSTTGSQVNPSTSGSQVNPSTTGSAFYPTTTSEGSLNTPNVVTFALPFPLLALGLNCKKKWHF